MHWYSVQKERLTTVLDWVRTFVFCTNHIVSDGIAYNYDVHGRSSVRETL